MKRKEGFSKAVNRDLEISASSVFRLSIERAGIRCPLWARSPEFKSEFLRIYKRSAIKNRFNQRGDRYHVDHIVPLKGEKVCGLHVPWNLHVINSVINMAKGTMIVPEWLNKDVNRERAEREQCQKDKRNREGLERRERRSRIMRQVEVANFVSMEKFGERLARRGDDYDDQFRFVTEGL